MRYMIAHMIGGEAKEYHENLSRALASAYRLRPVTANIDPHITIKAPFDALSTDLYDIERSMDRFVRTRSPLGYTLKNFGNFDDRVVFMDVDAPAPTLDFVRELKEELRQTPWLEFKPHEESTKLHSTLCFPKDAVQTEEIVRTLTLRGGRAFACTMSSIALLKRGERRWEMYKEFHFAKDDVDMHIVV